MTTVGWTVAMAFSALLLIQRDLNSPHGTKIESFLLGQSSTAALQFIVS